MSVGVGRVGRGFISLNYLALTEHVKCFTNICTLQTLFGKDADKLEQANDDEKTCILVYLLGMKSLLQDKT